MEEQEYLEPGFDPATLTMPRLRSILVAHGVNYPASSKKGQLVDIFNEEVLPQARRLRAANARVKRTSRGIEDIASQTSSAADEGEEDIPEPPRSVARSRSSRRSTRARTEEVPEVAPTPRATRLSTAPPQSATPRRVSTKHARAPEPVEEPEPKRPASRKSAADFATPVAKRDGLTRDETSPFSNQNVFQSGGSPPAPRTSDRRRTTYGTGQSVSRTRSREARRRTEEHRPLRDQTDGVTVPTRRTFEVPVPRAAKEEHYEEVEPDEEFTPEEEQALVQSQQAGNVVPARRKPRAPGSVARVGPLALISALLASTATLYRQEKLQVGYCGVGHPTTEIAGHVVPDWADIARPTCEPCPPHAYCYENLDTECESGFVLTQHPLSLNGLIPLPPSCEPDSARERKVQAIKARAVETLREQNAKYECGDSSAPEVKEPELKKVISSMIPRKKLTNQEFEDLWSGALGEVQDMDEIKTGTDGITGFTLRSNSLARIPFVCAVRRSLLATLRQYLWQLVTAALATSSIFYTRHRITDSRTTESQAKQLAGMALRKLSEQASLHAADPGTWGESYISMAQLRDDVLRDEFSASRRKKLWEKVQAKVEANSNVRPMVREGRAGDVGRVWEWIGAVGAIESPAAPSYSDSEGKVDRRRKSGGGFRDSLGGIAGEKLIEPNDAARASADGSRRSLGKWEESPGKYY